MRLLFVAPYAPSPIRVRTWSLIRSLADAGHAITLVALDDGSGDASTWATLAEVCAAVHRIPLSRPAAALRCLAALPTSTPLWVAYCREPALGRTVRALADSGGFDAAHVEHLRAAWVAGALAGLPSVIDAVDCIAELQEQLRHAPGSPLARLVAGREARVLRAAETALYARFDRIAVTTEHDAAALRTLAGNSGLPPVHTIPNGVDSDYFQPLPGVAPEPQTLVFSGKLSYRPNDDAARFLLTEVLPLVRRRRPAARLILAGSDPGRALRRLAAADPGILLTGRVPDLRPFLARASAAICPMRIGVGVQNKALEAMAMGLPVVATGRVARSMATEAIVVAESAQELAAACERLLADPESARERGRRARAYVVEKHRWCRAAERFEELYRQARQGRAL